MPRRPSSKHILINFYYIHFQLSSTLLLFLLLSFQNMARERANAKQYTTEVAPSKLACMVKNRDLRVLDPIEEEEMDDVEALSSSLRKILFMTIRWRIKLR